MRDNFEKAIDLAAARVLAIRAEHCREVNKAMRGGGSHMAIPIPAIREGGGRPQESGRPAPLPGRGSGRVDALRRSQGVE